MKKNKKRIVIIFLIVFIVLFSIIANYRYSFKVHDMRIPGSFYKVRLSKINRKLSIKAYYYCSYVNCKTRVENYKVTLTKEEMKKIQLVFNKIEKLYLAHALECIAKDKEVWEDFETNEKTTYREEGNEYLDILIEELGL